MFSLICAWTNGWLTLSRFYDVIVMKRMMMAEHRTITCLNRHHISSHYDVTLWRNVDGVGLGGMPYQICDINHWWSPVTMVSMASFIHSWNNVDDRACVDNSIPVIRWNIITNLCQAIAIKARMSNWIHQNNAWSHWSTPWCLLNHVSKRVGWTYYSSLTLL